MTSVLISNEHVVIVGALSVIKIYNGTHAPCYTGGCRDSHPVWSASVNIRGKSVVMATRVRFLHGRCPSCTTMHGRTGGRKVKRPCLQFMQATPSVHLLYKKTINVDYELYTHAFHGNFFFQIDYIMENTCKYECKLQTLFEQKAFNVCQRIKCKVVILDKQISR